jgi:cutinase
MKCNILAVIAIATGIFAAPTELVKKQNTGITENEYTRGSCRNILFFFARGSTEIGNMVLHHCPQSICSILTLILLQGSTVGPPTSDGLKRAFGSSNVATEGVDYPALISTNLLPGGADPVGISDLSSLVRSATTRCPNSVIVVGGYSYVLPWAQDAIPSF